MFPGSYFWSDLSISLYQVEPYAVAVSVLQTWLKNNVEITNGST